LLVQELPRSPLYVLQEVRYKAVASGFRECGLRNKVPDPISQSLDGDGNTALASDFERKSLHELRIVGYLADFINRFLPIAVRI
jgi:hypothetical protein